MRSPNEQHHDNRTAADGRGVTLGQPYREAKAVGASRHSRGTRDDFARLLADIEAGQFGADELWLWEPSRGSRKVGEWVRLIEACEAARVGIYVTTHGRLYDPANPRDRRSMLEDAVDAEYETAKTRERVNRGVRSRAAAGRPHGRLLYGYEREHDSRTRAYLRQIPHPGQAPIVAEVFRRFAEGESCPGIAGSLTRRGVPTPNTARVWRSSTLYSMLTNRGYLGERVSTAGHATVKDAWPALVDETTWIRCQNRLADPDRAPRQDMTVKHLLSGLAVCGKCGGKLVYNPGTGRITNGTRPRAYPSYICADRRCLARLAGTWSPDSDKMNGLEGQVVEFVLEFWANNEFGRVRQDNQLAAAEVELARLRADLKVWQDSAGEVTLASVASAERKLIPRIQEMERGVKAMRARGALPDLGGQSLRDAWPGLSLAQQRVIIAASTQIVVHPVGRGRRYDPSTVEIRPRWS